MPGRKRLTNCCYRCRMHTHLCICADMPRLDLTTRLILVMHYREIKKQTSTAVLALNTLANSEYRLHGLKHQELKLNDLDDPTRRLLVLYPDPNAVTLSPSILKSDERPVSLLIPDGSWRQVARMRHRLLSLPYAETVKLPPGPPSQWTIRKTTHSDHLSTYEAIARALGIIESPPAQHQMETIFRLMVQRTRIMRGLPPLATAS